MNRYWLKSGSFNFMQLVSTIILAFGSYFMLVRVVPKSDFGVWVLFLTITSIIEVARISLLQNGLVKYTASILKHEKSYLNTASLTLNILFTVLIILLLLALSGYISRLLNSPQLKVMLYFYCITSIILIPFTQFSFMLQANLNFKGLFISVTSRHLLFFVLSFIVYLQLFEISLFQLVVFHAIAALLGSITGFFVLRKQLIFSSQISWSWIVKLFKYGKYTVGTGLGSILNSSVDQLMIGSIISSSSVAVYNAALRVPNLINIPANVIATILFPQSSKLDKSESQEKIRDYYERSVGINLAIIIPAVIFVLIFSELVITIIAGKNYIDAVQILKVMIIYTLMVPFGKQFGTILDSIGYPNLNFYVTILSALANVVLNYFMIHSYGVMGAIYGTLISYILSLVVIHSILYKIIKVRPFVFVNHIISFYTKGFVSLRNYVFNRSE